MRPACFIFVLVMAAAGSAHAQADDAAARIHDALVARQRGDDDGALRILQEVFERTHDAHAEAQMALAEQALGHWLDAERHLREALASQDAWVLHHRAILDGAMSTIQTHVGQLELRGGAPGAEVLIDGRSAGTMPLAAPVHALAGSVTVTIHAQGYAPLERRVTIQPGALSREDIALVAVASAPPSAAPAAAASSAPSAAPTPSAPSATVAQRGSGHTGLTVAAGVLAVLAAGGGLAANLDRESMVSTYNSATCAINGATRATNCGWMIANIDALEALEIAGYALGGALAVVTVVLAVTAPHAERPRQGRSSCGAGPGQLGIACGIAF